ncbi:MAG: Dockerin domain-containing protein [Clostridium sp.]
MKKQFYSRAGRIGCLLLAVIFAVSSPATAAVSAEATKKDETVYVNLSATGQVQNITVSDWLHTDSNVVRLPDKSNLENIKNVKSSVQPEKIGDNLTWVLNSDGENGADIYYQGTTSKPTPLEVNVSYELNGKTVTPEEIAGKSGKVKITVSLKNTDAHTVQVNGKDVVMYTPMTAVVTANLPSDTFRNVSVSKGKVISDGNNQFVTFLCMPGLSESLDLKNCGVKGLDTLDLPESLEITADATNFTLGSIAVVATPELPNEDDFDSDGSLDDLRDDLDKLSQMQDNIEKADPDKEIRSLFTNPDRTAAARLIVDDVFDFYDLDTAALDIMPKYVTDENISLYDRVTSDIDKADLKYVLDNEIIRGLNDRLTDENIEKAKILLADYDEIETFQIGKLDRVIHVLDNYDKNYDRLDDALTQAKHIIHRLDDEDFDTLAALSDSDVQDSLADTLESMSELNEAMASLGLSQSSISLEKEDVEALLQSVLSRNFPKLIAESVESKADEDGNISVSNLMELTKALPSDAMQSTTASAIMAQLADSFVKSNPDAVISASNLENIQPSEIVSILAENPDAVIPASEVRTALETLVGTLSDEERAAIISPLAEKLSPDLTDSLNDLLSNSADLQDSLEDELGSDYTSKLTAALANIGHIKGYIDDLQDDLDDLDEDELSDLEDDFDDAKDLLLDKDDMDYLITWAKKLRDMKTDMDDNKDNISILRDLIDLNDDPKIKNFRSMIPDLLADWDDSRPILDAIKAELDEPTVNASLHKMPQTTAVLTKMEDDIRNHRDIMEIFRLTTQPDTVSLFNDTFTKLDDFIDEGTVDNITTLMDKKDAYIDLSEQYKIFTEAADGAETRVKFVYKTAEIEEPESNETPVVEAVADSENSGFRVLGWIRSVWNKAANTISHLF